MNQQKRLEEKLQATFQPLYLEIVNESPSHGRPTEAESHFRLVIVSAAFEGKSLVEQQRLVYGLFKEELKESIHAFSVKTVTPSQWEAQGQKVNHQTPLCKGGSTIKSHQNK